MSGTDSNVGNADVKDASSLPEQNISSDNRKQPEMNPDSQELVSEILRLKGEINTMVGNIRNTKSLCEKYESENQYLQDYVGNLMRSGEINR